MKSLRSIIVVLVSMLPLSTYAQSKEVEYNARRAATIQAMDSVLKYARMDTETLMKYADDKCKAFKNDTLLMNRIAEAFSTYGGYHDQAIERFRELKRVHPKYIDGYINFANVLHSLGTKVTETYALQRDPNLCKLAKAQIDSVKTIVPKDTKPYLAWIGICAPFAFSDAVAEDLNAEVEALNKAFPQSNAYYLTANILNKAELQFQNIPNDSAGLRKKSDWKFIVDKLALSYYEKTNINAISYEELYQLCSMYYSGTRSPYLNKQDRMEMLEKGMEHSLKGEERFPEKSDFIRLLLWYYGELSKYDKEQSIYYSGEAHKAAESFFSKEDNVIGVDYFYDALALQNLGRFSEAIDMYRKALNRNVASEDRNYHRDSLTCYENIRDCCLNTNDYQNALDASKSLIEMKKRKKTYSLNDASGYAKIFETMGKDSLLTNEDRMNAFVHALSVYDEINTLANRKERGFELNEGFIGYPLYLNIKVREEMDKIEPDRSDFQTYQMANEIIDKVSPVVNKSKNEIGFLVTAYEKLRVYYNKGKDYKESLKCVEMVETLKPGTYKLDLINAQRKLAGKKAVNR